MLRAAEPAAKSRLARPMHGAGPRTLPANPIAFKAPRPRPAAAKPPALHGPLSSGLQAGRAPKGFSRIGNWISAEKAPTPIPTHQTKS